MSGLRIESLPSCEPIEDKFPKSGRPTQHRDGVSGPRPTQGWPGGPIKRPDGKHGIAARHVIHGASSLSGTFGGIGSELIHRPTHSRRRATAIGLGFRVMTVAIDHGPGAPRRQRSTSHVISGVDLFCGVGGLSDGLQKAGILICAGIDIDPACAYPFETNIESPFIERDIRDVSGHQIDELWIEGSVKLLAGCAPCQPFSPYRRGVDTTSDSKWPLLEEFGRLVDECKPDLVTMENVPRIGKSKVFLEFVELLRAAGYHVDFRSCYGPHYGLPQHRRRLLLVASQLGEISVPAGHQDEDHFPTVRDAIASLPPIVSGETHDEDPLHTSRTLSEVNLERIRASAPGGTWQDWPEELRAPCHRRTSGSTFLNVYSRMAWDEPAPTITTLATNFGAGRFGHPEQDRPISLREAALLQGFDPDYAFVRATERPQLAPITRLIGNAVPPPLGFAIGMELMEHVKNHRSTEEA